MQIIEIEEPAKSDLQGEIIVGIDFGTTNSLIAYSRYNNPQIINSVGKRGLLPSVIFYNDQLEKFIIGKKTEGINNISSIKRLFAKSYEEIKSTEVLNKMLSGFALLGHTSSMPKVTFGSTNYSFPELAAKIFLFLKEHAEQELGTAINKAVVSVPAYFDDGSRGAVMLAAKLAGFDVLRLIAEPTAAAYAYGFHKKSEGAYMIYDLGGGTFDISILSMEAGIFQVIATGGDTLLGGDDLDHILAEYIAKELNISLEPSLYLKAKELKELLSSQNSASLNFRSQKFKITRKVFENLISQIINKTIKIAKNTLFDADVKLDGIVLVGGSTRIPFIAQNLTKAFGVKIFSDIDPDRAVVIGAALQAENLSLASSRSSLLIDVLPLSVGMELYGGLAEKVIMRNTPIPFSITKIFTTYADYQTGMQFHIVQGEREMVRDCRSLARFELKNIPAMKAGRAKIEVTFAIDADGILSVTAKEHSSGIAQNIELKPSYGLSQIEINTMLENAFKNAEEDYRYRLLIQTRIDAQNVITGIKKALNETPGILKVSEKAVIISLIKALQKIIYSNDRDEILIKISELNASAAGLIERHLNSGAKSLLEGRNINNL